MITINRTYTITLLDSNVINYTITSNKSCITIDKASGSFNGTTKKIYVTYYVTDLDCFTGNLITVNVTNDKACSNSFTDTLTNECNSLDVSIEQPDSNNLAFNAIVTGGKPPYLFNWIYGLESQFSSNEPNTGFHSQNQLSLIWNHNPANILPPGYKNPQGVRVRVQDSNGCISEALNYYTLTCEPFIASQTIAAQCFPLTTGDIRKFVLTLTNSGCGNLVNNPLVINYTGVTSRSIGNNSYEIIVPEFNTTSVILPITVTNDKNVPSSIFNVTVTKTGNCKIKPDCAAGFILNEYNNTTNSKTLEFDNSAYAITDVVDFATDYIDYDTFTFVASPGQVLTNPTILTITNKGVATFNAATKIITYTQSIANVSVIPIKWKVKNECDVFSQEFTLNINSVLSTAPTVTNLTKTIFFGDTSTTTVTSNNNTTISSLKIITSPTVGTLSVNGNVVTYIPVSYSSNTQTVTLQPVNQYGKVGNSFTVTHTILSSGIARPLTTCSALTSYNLFNLLVAGSYTTGGTWTSSPSVNTGNLATITTAGIYNFTYTVTSGGLTKSTTVTINYSSASITSVGVTNLEFNTRTVKITTSGFTQSELDLISYVTVNVITPTKQLSLTTNLITDRNGDILFTEIDITDEDGIILSDYTRIEVVIPEEKSPCATIITASYVKPAVGLVSTLTASVIVNDSTIFNCEGGYTYTYNSATEIYTGYKSVAAIAPASPYGVEIGDSNVFGIYGTRIYPVNGWNDKGDLKSGYTYQNLMTTSYWQNTAVADFEKGPCNRYGIWANDGEASTDLPFGKWIGFSKCITIAESKTYYVGLFADNNFKLRLNGQTILNTYQTGGSLNSTQATFFYWHIYPIDIPAGNNTLELTGLNIQQTGAFGCVIYDNTPTQLVAATSDGNLNIIFNSRTITNIDIVESTLGVYEDKGYTCPPGYTVYSPCGGNNCYQYIVCGTPNSN